MTLDEFIQREIDRGRIKDAECFYIALYSLKLDNGTKLKVNDYAKYLDYELKKVVIEINFHPMGGCMLYEVELVSEEDEEDNQAKDKERRERETEIVRNRDRAN